MTKDQIQHEVQKLGPWFHNLNIGGVFTAPDHFLGDYPQSKWQKFASVVPADLSGKSVLDIGCNAGFYSIEMKRRGAERVLGIDHDDSYLAQARFAAKMSGAEIEFVKMSVYDVAQLGERFDVVLFLGVLYHLRYPLLALDLLHQHVVGEILIMQSMIRGTPAVACLEPDYPFEETQIFEKEGFPKMYFIENSYSHDPTNWWIPNNACVEAMLRSAGFRIVAHPEREIYICRREETESHG
ncbi:MAG TPA: TIGR04290 family methyltransferase [Bryobacteraceae bacterium]|nr:TIGR04290 family methyltransferase [Bryobacteraceae bacterium]